MDTLTHALSGALLARATAPGTPRPDQLPLRLRSWVGFWAAMFPDSDAVLRFVDSLTYLSAHRGVTHSLPMLPLWALLLAFLFTLILRHQYSWRAFVGPCALGIGIHILGDVITAFGTIVFAPFSDWRAQIPTTFIIDPYFTGILVMGLVASAWARAPRLPAIAALLVLTGFVGFQAIQLQRAIAVGEQYIAAQALTDARAYAVPQPFSPFHWLVVVEQPDRYHLAHISLIRKQTPPAGSNWLASVYASYRPVTDANWRAVSRFGTDDPALAQEAWQADGLARYRHFTMFPALLRMDRESGRTCVWFDDLRFDMAGRHGPFRYGVCRENEQAPWRTYELSNDKGGEDIFYLIPE